MQGASGPDMMRRYDSRVMDCLGEGVQLGDRPAGNALSLDVVRVATLRNRNANTWPRSTGDEHRARDARRIAYLPLRKRSLRRTLGIE